MTPRDRSESGRGIGDAGSLRFNTQNDALNYAQSLVQKSRNFFVGYLGVAAEDDAEAVFQSEFCSGVGWNVKEVSFRPAGVYLRGEDQLDNSGRVKVVHADSACSDLRAE